MKVTSFITRSGKDLPMARYQFFTVPTSNRQQYTFVDMASPTFLIEKEALLAQGFEVEEDFIDAHSREEAVEKYRSNFLYVADEVGKSDSSYAAASALMEMGKKLFGRKTNG
jgi:2-methylaconitate cis-trans-isomerase PrpF